MGPQERVGSTGLPRVWNSLMGPPSLAVMDESKCFAGLVDGEVDGTRQRAD
jgi:hypothetical protein